MITVNEEQLNRKRIISQETRSAQILGIAILISIICYALLAKFVKIEINLSPNTTRDLYQVLILLVIIIMIVIFSLKKSIYYSSKLIKEDYTLQQILQKWKTIDIILMAGAESIAILGLIITFIGVPFQRTWYIFFGSALLIIILMPMGIKVRGKLTTLMNNNPSINV